MYGSRIVLHAPVHNEALLDEFVEACLRDGVELIAVVGPGCERIHDMVDALIVRDGSDETRFIATTWHDHESVEEVVEFASHYSGETGRDDVQQVVL